MKLTSTMSTIVVKFEFLVKKIIELGSLFKSNNYFSTKTAKFL